MKASDDMQLLAFCDKKSVIIFNSNNFPYPILLARLIKANRLPKVLAGDSNYDIN